ncbi:MAG TPA: helicase, partial [Methylocella sp.]|nr:helicase [Methylocella sp.]
DRRTSVLMRRLRENVMLEAEVTPGGDVLVEGQHVGQLIGFRFTADPAAAGEAARTLNAAAQKALASEIEGRAARLCESVDEALLLANDGIIRWLGEPVGKVCAGAHVLEPRVTVLADEQLTGPALEKVQRRLELWLAQHVKKLLGPLADLEKGEGLEGIVRGIAFQIAESLGVLDRSRVAEEVKTLSQEDRAALRKFGVRFGAYHLYLPNLIKPAPRALAAQLHALKHGGDAVKGLDDVLHLAASGRTSLAASQEIPKNLYRAAGFRVCGDRAVRIDILERLADLIRPAISYRPGITPGDPPPGAADGDGFVVTVAMTSLAGCSGESFASILRALGYVPEQRKGPPITAPSPAGHAAPLPDETGKATLIGSSAAESPQGAQEACEAQPVPPAHLDAEGRGAAGGEKESLTEALPAGGCAENQELAAKGVAATASPAGPGECLIEVWRPHRQQHHARRREGAQVRPAGWRKKETGASPRPHAARPPIGESNGAPRAAQPDKTAEKSGDPPGAALHAEAAGQGSAGRDAAGGGMRSESRRGGWKQPGDKSRLASKERGGPQRLAASKEKKHGEKPPDPNSPFAKLLELKARLEEKNNTGR